MVVQRSIPAAENGAWPEDFRNRLRGIVALLRSQGISTTSIAAELRAMAKVVTRS
jgi:hypothetical protein